MLKNKLSKIEKEQNKYIFVKNRLAFNLQSSDFKLESKLQWWKQNFGDTKTHLEMEYQGITY